MHAERAIAVIQSLLRGDRKHALDVLGQLVAREAVLAEVDR
jgi:hypothetical protein